LGVERDTRKSRAAITILIIASISFFAVGSFLFVFGPTLQVKWSQTYPGGELNSKRSAQMTSDGGFIMAGFSLGPLYNSSRRSGRSSVFSLQKIDSHGTTQWNKTYPSTNDSLAFCVDQTTDGGYIISGMTALPPYDFNMSFLLVKVDQNGNEEWNRTYAGGYSPLGTSVQQTTDGGYILTGGDGVYIIKTYHNGSLQWSRTYSFFMGSSNSILQTSDGGYILLGSDYPLAQDLPAILLLKMDAAGNPQWNRTIASTEYVDSYPSSIQETSDGGYLVSGTTHRCTGNNSGIITEGNSLAFLLKLYSNGTTQWNETFNVAGWSNGMVARQTSDGGYIFSVYAPWGLGGDAWLWKTDENGATLWNKPVASDVSVFFLKQTADGNYVLAGFSSSVSAVLMRVSGAPPLFSPEVIPILYMASIVFLVATAVSGIAVHLEPRKKYTK
jgi:hypothetical protein